ncbi:MAG: Hsp20 family protein [Bdellovibrionota bacterium]
MEVDKSGADNSAAARIATKKNQQEVEEQRAQMELGRMQRDREKALEAEREKGDRAVVEISNAASNQLDAAKKINSARVQALSDNQQKSYEALATKTAEDLKRLDSQAFNAIEDHKAGTMEKIANVTQRGEDPFYRLKSLNPVVATGEAAYTISVSLPEHEAQNLFVSGEGPYVKLSLARRFQDHAAAPEGGRVTRTNSYQSVVEQVAMPGAYDAKKIERTYKDGVVTITIPKAGFGPPGAMKG